MILQGFILVKILTLQVFNEGIQIFILVYPEP